MTTLTDTISTGRDKSNARATQTAVSNVPDADAVVYEAFTDEAATAEAVAVKGAPLPLFTIRRYAYVAAAQAEGKMLDDGTCYLEVPGLTGVWAAGPSLREAFDELRGVIFEWVAVKYAAGDNDIPVLGNIRLNRG